MSKKRRCPGRCAKFIPRHKFSCTSCWDKLPAELRRPILATIGKPTSRTRTLAWMNGAGYFDRSVR